MSATLLARGASGSSRSRTAEITDNASRRLDGQRNSVRRNPWRTNPETTEFARSRGVPRTTSIPASCATVLAPPTLSSRTRSMSTEALMLGCFWPSPRSIRPNLLDIVAFGATRSSPTEPDSSIADAIASNHSASARRSTSTSSLGSNEVSTPRTASWTPAKRPNGTARNRALFAYRCRAEGPRSPTSRPGRTSLLSATASSSQARSLASSSPRADKAAARTCTAVTIAGSDLAIRKGQKQAHGFRVWV